MFGKFDPDQKAQATLDAVRHCHCIVVHKGAETIIATPDGHIWSNAHATPFLASAGTGDVLAGMIGGLLAQGMTAAAATCAAAWIHGEAGRRLGPGLIAEDLIVALPAILNDLAPNHLKAASFLTDHL